MKQTALQQAIEYCLTLTPICHQDMAMYNSIVSKLKQLIPTEREQIEDAYWGGINGCINDYTDVKQVGNEIIGVKVGGGASNYYEETYKK